MKKYIFLLIFIILFSVLTYPYTYTNKQRRLFNLLDTYDMETKWLPGYNVDCETGEYMPPKSTWVKSSHCSCFVYRVCNDLNVKLIGTKEGFNQYKLSTNQLKWLNSDEGKKSGWKKIQGNVTESYVNANKEANKGNLVLAGIEEDENVLGHISIVRPSNRTDDMIKRDGPDTIASSKINSRSVFLREDFMFNRKNMENYENKIQIFVNEMN